MIELLCRLTLTVVAVVLIALVSASVDLGGPQAGPIDARAQTVSPLSASLFPSD